MRKGVLLKFVVITVFLFQLPQGCGSNGSFVLTSTAFTNNSNIPAKFSCDGQNISPPLQWEGAPSNTLSFALVLHDPDAPLSGGFTHWVIYDIPSGVKSLDENLPKTALLANGATQGNNGSNALGYTGPCPPAGKAHHYNFTLYALDIVFNLRSGISQNQLETTMKGHILAQTRLTGLYQRAS